MGTFSPTTELLLDPTSRQVDNILPANGESQSPVSQQLGSVSPVIIQDLSWVQDPTSNQADDVLPKELHFPASQQLESVLPDTSQVQDPVNKQVENIFPYNEKRQGPKKQQNQTDQIVADGSHETATRQDHVVL